MNFLPTQLQQLADGQLERLAIVVDADQVANGGGFAKTLEQTSAILSGFGFISPPSIAGKGLIFKHNDGLADFGLWVMPDNLNEGMLENWISQCCHPQEQTLFLHAKTTVSALPVPKFKPIRTTKAEVATWLAWQNKPGEGLYYAIEGDLLDKTAPLYRGLETWLNQVFR